MKKIFILAFCFSLPLVSCNKWLDQPPTGNLREDLFNTADDAQETLNSCYDALANLYDGRIQNISELLSDNLNQPNTNNDLRSVFARQTTFFNGTTNKVYQDLYTVVWRCNTLLDNIDVIPNFETGEKERLIAEARFLRGFCHWSAVKLWAQPYGWTPGNTHAGVPIRNRAAADPLLRSTVQEVYDFVQEDLEFAYNNLPETNGIYASKMAAAGVLATFHFLKQEWSQTIQYSSEVINSGNYTFDTESLDRYPEITQGNNTTTEFVFGTVSTLYSIDGGSLAQDRRCGSYVSNYQINNGIAELMVSQNFQDYINLNAADKRLQEWFSFENNRAFLKKFFINQIYSVPIVHLTELHLVRAEAIAENGGDLNTAREDLNKIINRAYPPGYELTSGATAEDIIAEARRQYRIELIGEGKYTEQLRRYGVMGESVIIRNAPYDCPGMAIQFPNAESTVIGFELNPEGGCN
ncbi:MAG: RagB/SusD family nutrient uptake outer membrane protein [Flavobacteriales bacterium]